jgi:hypothetical protein
MKTKAQQVAAILKQHGISSKQVSCRNDHGSISCRIKDISIDPEFVERIVRKFESIRYCEYSQEILNGGNTFVSIQYDWEVEKAICSTQEFKDFKTALKAKLDAITGNECAEMGNALFYRENNIILRYEKGDRSEVEPYHNLDSLAWSVYTKIANGTIKGA